MKRMSFVAAAVTAFTVAAVGLAGWIGARPDDRLLPVGRFRVKTLDVHRDDDTLVCCIDIEAHPGAVVRLFTDVPNRGGLGTVVPDRAGSPIPARLTIFGDHVKWKTDAVKFLMKLGGVSGSATSMDIGPMPPGKVKLTDVLSVDVESGVYKEGVPIPGVTFDGTVFKLIVERPQPDKGP